MQCSYGQHATALIQIKVLAMSVTGMSSYGDGRATPHAVCVRRARVRVPPQAATAMRDSLTAHLRRYASAAAICCSSTQRKASLPSTSCKCESCRAQRTRMYAQTAKQNHPRHTACHLHSVNGGSYLARGIVFACTPHSGRTADRICYRYSGSRRSTAPCRFACTCAGRFAAKV